MMENLHCLVQVALLSVHHPGRLVASVSSFCLLHHEKPYCTDQGINVGIKPSVKYSNHNWNLGVVK